MKSVRVSPRGRASLVSAALALALASSLTAAAAIPERDRVTATSDQLDQIGQVEETAASALPLDVRQRLATALRPDGATGAATSARRLFEISTTTGFDLPVAARRAYQAAARTLARSRPGCGIDWTLVAGIGRVESDHGRYGGSQLGRDGVSRPLIRGVALNGVGPVAAIADTDRGRLDGDRVWDRAVGPMQFIPSTWRTGGRDGDEDGVRDPDDLDDAALATADYLCRAGGDLTTETGRRTAVFAYNHSDYYVDLVLAFATGYDTGVFDIPSPELAEDPVDDDGAANPRKGRRPAEGAKPDGPTPATPAPTTSPTPTAPQGGSGGSGAGQGGGKGGSGKGGSDKGSNGKGSNGKGSGTGGSGGGKGGGPKPTPAPAPELEQRTGLWTSCNDGWCLTGAQLDLSRFGSTGTRAAADYDGDGAVETNGEEFAGLAAQTVTVTVQQGTSTVYGIG